MNGISFIRHIDVDWLFDDFSGEDSLKEIVFLAGFWNIDDYIKDEIAERLAEEMPEKYREIFALCEQFQNYENWKIPDKLVKGLVAKYPSLIVDELERYGEKLKRRIIVALSECALPDIHKKIVPYLLNSLFIKQPYEGVRTTLNIENVSCLLRIDRNIYQHELEEMLRKMEKEEREWCGNLLLHSPLPGNEEYATVSGIPISLKDEPIIKDPVNPGVIKERITRHCLTMEKGELVEVIEPDMVLGFARVIRCYDYSLWMIIKSIYLEFPVKEEK